MIRQLTAIIEREGDSYVALCPEIDTASQGGLVDEARANLKDALDLFFETASDTLELGRGRLSNLRGHCRCRPIRGWQWPDADEG